MPYDKFGGWGPSMDLESLGAGAAGTATLPGGWSDDEFADLLPSAAKEKAEKQQQYAADYAAMADQIEQQRANGPKPWDLPPNATELESLRAKRLKELYTGDEEGLANRQRRIADFQQWYDTETDPERKKEALLALQMERSSEQAHRERIAAEQADLGLRGITPEQKMLEEREAVERGLGPDMALANAPVMRGAITGTSNAASSIGEIAMRILPGEGAPSEMADGLGRERMAEGQYQAYLDEKQGTAAALTNQLSQMTAEYLPLAASGVPAWLQVGAKGANDAYLKSDSDAYALTSGVIQGAATFFGGKLAGGTWIDMLSGKVAGKTIGPMLKGFGIESGEELSQLYLQALVDRGFGVGDGRMPTLKDAMWTLAVTAGARGFGSIMSGSIEDDGTPTVLSGDRALNAVDRVAGRAANAIQEKVKAFVDSERPSRKAAKEVGVDQIATTAKERSELAADIRNRLTGQQFEEQLRAAAVSPAQAELDLEGWKLLAAAAGESFDDFVGKRVKTIEKTTSDKSAYLAQRQSGRPDSLAQDQPAAIDTPEFKKWFGKSKVVDADGKPLRVFHGTGDDFEEFKQGVKARASTRDSKEAFFFTTNADHAAEFTYKSGDFKGIIKPVYLKAERLLTVEVNSDDYNPQLNFDAVKRAKAEGYDGVVFKGQGDPWGNRGDSYAVFSPTQIKSATGNRGTFDPDDPSILAQKKGPTPRGEVQFHKDGRATIRLFETANESTFTHETAHILRRYLQGEDLKKAERWAGVRGGRWDRKAEEKFARGWERYLRDGIAPNKALESIFARFKAALSRVYSVVAKSPLNVDITPEMRGVFDRLLVPAEARTTSPGNFSRKVDNPQSQAAAVEVSDADVLAETRGLSPTSNKNAVVDEERAKRGLPPMMAPAREANADAWDAAMRKIDRNPNHAEELQQSLAKSPRALTAEENAALLHRRVTLRNDYYDALEQWQDAIAAGNTDLAAELDARVSAASDRLADLEEVTKAVGTESGRSLQARKMMAEEDYSLARMEMETAQAKGGPLTAEERQEVVDQNKKIVEKQRQLDEHEAVTEAAEETKAVAEAMEEAKKPVPGKKPTPGKKPQATADPQQDIDAAIAAIKAKVDKEETSSITPFVQKLAKLFWQQGIREQEPMIDALHGVLEPMIPGWTRDQTQRAFSGYGNFSPLSKDEMSVGLRDLKGQTQQLLKIEALEARKPLEKTGVERRQPSFEERRLQKIVNELKRKYGVVVTDPETQLKSALEARKTYYRNRLVDLKEEIDSRQRVIKDKSPSPTDPELESLVAEYRELQTQHQEIFGKREMTDAERLKLALAAAEKTEARWQERLAAAKEGKFDPATGEKRKLTSPELEAVRARSEAIREEVELLKSLDSNINEQRQVNSLTASLADVEAKINSGDIAAPKRPFGPDSKAVSELKGKLDAARDRLKAMREASAEYTQKQLDAAKAATQAAIDSLAKRIAAGDISVSKSGKAGPVDSELKLLRYQREYLNKVMADLRNAAKPKKTAEQIALQSLKARMKNEAAKLAEKLAAGDFSETPRKIGPKLDAEGAKLKAELDMLRKEYREGLERDRWNKSSIWQKGKRYAVDAYDLGRLLMTTGEMSFLLRQGKLAAVSHPIKTGRALGAAFRAMRNETTARAIENQIISHPKFDEAKAARLHLTDEDSSLNKQEEFLTSRLAGRIPGVAAFARAGRVFMNKLRFDMYLAMEKAATRTGTATEEERNAIATFINESTGRGGLGKVGEPAAVFLGRLLFSPRYLASRFQMLAGHSMWGGTNRSRRLIAKEYGRIIAGMGVYYSLLAMLFSLGDEEKDGSIVTDPRSSDFGKIRIGDSRLDPMAGLSQVVTLISRLTTGETKTVSGKVLPLRGKTKFGQRDAFRVMADFARSKAHPFPATIINLLAGKDLAGEEVTVAGEAARSAAPITYKDIYDALREHGLAEGGALGLLAFFGEGLQHYGKN